MKMITLSPINRASIALLTAALCHSTPLLAQSEEDIMFSYGDESFISIATGRKQSIARAPSVASVVTAEQIKQIGAKDITEVMETIPGVHVSRKAGGYNPIFVFRGIYSEYNPQVLILIDGMPITSLLFGDRGQVWGGLPVEAISRIEVIRGPGSAIYGADAFAGTINIITKKAEDIQQTELGYSYGTYDEQHAWAVTAGEIAGWKTSFSAEWVGSDGQDETIERDLQNDLDALFGTDASLAPGDMSSYRRSYDIYLNAEKDKWNLNINYANRENLGTAIGASNALDQSGNGDGNRLNTQLTYTTNDWLPDTESKTSLSYQKMRNELNLALNPPGFGYPTPGGPVIFPDGVLGSPDYYEKHIRFDWSLFYSGIENHSLSLGLGYHVHDQYKVEETKNYQLVLTPAGPLPTPLSGFIDVSDTAPFNQEETRRVKYLYLQDVWQIAPDWSLTAGFRYDDYSDFGDTLNPRLALVWQTSYALTTKILYGQAFRAPSFAELFNINNPVANGNPDLDPEVIDTYELAFNYTVNQNLQFGLNFFYYQIEDMISFNPPSYIAENSGDQDGHGFEFEFKWQATDNLNIQGNYAMQSSKNDIVDGSDEDVANAPGQQLYLNANYAFNAGWSADLKANHVRDRERDPSDTRPTVDDYTQFDLTLRSGTVIPNWEFAMGIKNLTDEEIYEPSLAPGYIEYDLPQAGRNYFVEVRTTF